jgi:hypothetical protein
VSDLCSVAPLAINISLLPYLSYISVLLDQQDFSTAMQVFYYFSPIFTKGGTLLVAQLVEALRYKPEGRGFDSRWCHWNFSLT